jgi:hypothetical protein
MYFACIRVLAFLGFWDPPELLARAAREGEEKFQCCITKIQCQHALNAMLYLDDFFTHSCIHTQGNDTTS